MIESQTGRPRLWVDFQNADREGRVRLNCAGTTEDLDRQRLVFREGLALILYCKELEARATVVYSTDEHLWVAKLEPRTIRKLE
jgi:hypothetical protein